ncbi:hypothetical protein J5N97_017944 [Dioscorea zingiberensis]|uniref:Uncharacterized protein n=1 Tax=Dioscorea zingiberensis TaxID=325984 RepID=A0A9D5HGU5_9LILI|nr:hypothetical protein J5N97_017944 [Dioscorea zingiberensis]
MAREKTKMRKIANNTARQVTFSKRRKGLFKKAQELAILCDAEVALIVFSASGKLFEYASSSMCEILHRHNVQSNGLSNQQTLDLLTQNSGCSRLSKEFAKENRQLRQMRGEELQELTLEELLHLESTLDVGLNRVLERKEQQIMERLNGLEQKGMQLLEDNKKLREKVEELCMAEKQAVTDHPENAFNEDAHSSESVALDGDDISDTSLKLGPPGFNWK